MLCVTLLICFLDILCCLQLWQIHNAEQMILDDVEANPHKYQGKKLSELTDEEEIDDEKSVEYGKAKYKNTTVPRVTLVIIFSFLLFIVPWNDLCEIFSLSLAETKR